VGNAEQLTGDERRPVLIGGATRLPFIWVLLGPFIGPAIMAALILLWREWAAEGAV
jgi:hypothetical protein